MNAEDKLCPLAAAANPHETSRCLGEKCACYIAIDKAQKKAAEPETHLYEGCGLVARIPWNLAKRKTKPNTNPA